MELLPIIPTIILEYAEVDEASITRDTQPIRDLSLNSYDLMSVLGRLESELGVEIAERDVRHLVSLGDLDDYVRSQMCQ